MVKLAKYNESLDYVDKALDIDPTDILLLNGKAFTLALSGKNEEAYSVIKEVASSNPDVVYLQDTTAFILYNLGKYDDAKQYYDKALRLDPNLIERLTEKEKVAFDEVMNSTK